MQHWTLTKRVNSNAALDSDKESENEDPVVTSEGEAQAFTTQDRVSHCVWGRPGNKVTSDRNTTQ